jgi:cytochrome c
MPPREDPVRWGVMSLASVTQMKQFRAWALVAAVAASSAAGFAAGKGDPARGKAVFEQCSVCHNADSDEKKMGPGLKGLFKHEKMANSKKPTEANVRAKIDDGGNGMPGYKDLLTDVEKDDLIAYLKTL